MATGSFTPTVKEEAAWPSVGQYMPLGPEFQRADGPNFKLPYELKTAGRDFHEIRLVLFTEI